MCKFFKKDNKNDVANCRLFFKKYNRLLWRQCSLSTYCFKKVSVRQGLPIWFSNICDVCSIKMKLILTRLHLYCILLSVLMFVWINLNIPQFKFQHMNWINLINENFAHGTPFINAFPVENLAGKTAWLWIYWHSTCYCESPFWFRCFIIWWLNFPVNVGHEIFD